jgi:CRISPR-associated endonuclease Csn1
VERKKLGIPVIVTNPRAVWDHIFSKGIDEQSLLSNLPEAEWRLTASLQKDEMFVFRMGREALEKALLDGYYDLISNNLYRVQKISSGDYYFRHHLETRLEKDNIEFNQFVSIGKVIRIKSLSKFINQKPIKIRLNSLGMVEAIIRES